MFHIDLNSSIPLYEQLQHQIIELQLLGLLKADDALPSVRKLATQLGINPNTVSKAYTELEAQHIIYTIVGKGCYVQASQEILNKFKALKLQELQSLYQRLLNYGYSEQELISLMKGASL